MGVECFPPLSKQIFSALIIVFLSSACSERVPYQLWTYSLLLDVWRCNALVNWLLIMLMDALEGIIMKCS